MPEIDFNPGNRTQTGNDYPKLKLKMGEYARVLVIDPFPVFHWTHTLRIPKILNGLPVMKTVNRKDGTSFQDHVKDFVGSPQCFGDLGILKDKGVDARNCPLCARAQESGEIDPAKPRYAQHTIRYGTKPGGWDLRYPNNCELVMWAYGSQIYDKLNNIFNQYGNLRTRDLLLGPCTDDGYQKFEVMVGPDAAWQKDDQLKQMVLETYKGNRYPGSREDFCGRKTDRAFVERDIERIAERWRDIHQASTAGRPARTDGTEQVSVNHGLTDGLDSLDTAATPAGDTNGKPAWLANPDDVDALVAQQRQQAAQRAAAQPPAIDFDDLLGPGTAPVSTAPVLSTASGTPVLHQQPVPAPPSPVPAPPPPAPPAAAPVSSLDDFDGLLDAANR